MEKWRMQNFLIGWEEKWGNRKYSLYRFTHIPLLDFWKKKFNLKIVYGWHFIYLKGIRNQNKWGKVKGWLKKIKNKTLNRYLKKREKRLFHKGQFCLKWKRQKPYKVRLHWGQFWRNRRKKKIIPMHRDNFIQKGSPTFSSHFGEIIFWWAQRENTRASLVFSLTFSPKLSFSLNALFVLLENLL